MSLNGEPSPMVILMLPWPGRIKTCLSGTPASNKSTANVSRKR